MFALMFLVLAIPFSAFASNDLTLGAIETTDVVTDLEKMGVDITEYPKNVEMDHCRILTFLEYGFDYYSDTPDYGLYVYMYNPSGRVIDVNGQNYIQMQTKLIDNTVSSGWTKHKLELCSYSTTQGYEHVFYKFKVADVSGFRKNLSVDFRHYDISGVELHFSGNRNATDCNVAAVYSFTGFMPYRDPGRRVNNSLQMYACERPTVELELHPVSWKTKTSDKGVGYQYEVFSVYFSVPNDIIRDYGDKNNVTKGLVEIDGTFEEYKINGLVTQNQALYDLVFPYLGKHASDDIPFTLTTDGIADSDGLFWGRCYNAGKLDESFGVSSINTVFKTSSQNFESVAGLGLEDEIFNLIEKRGGKFASLPEVDEGCTKGYQPYNVKAKDDLADKIATFASNHKKWISFLLGVGNLDLEDESYDGIQGIQAIDKLEVMANSLYLSDATIAEKFYMQEAEADAFKRFVVSEAAKDKTTYILRYAVRDYYATENTYVYRKITEKYEDEALYFEKTVFFNFDILSLTWEDQYQKRMVIPVVASPVNNFGSITPPREPSIIGAIIDKGEELIDGGKDLFAALGKLKPWLILVAVLIVLAVLSWILSKLGFSLGGLFRGIGKVITAPFRGISKAVERRKESKEKREEKERTKSKEKREESKAKRDEEKHTWAREDRAKKSAKGSDRSSKGKK